jgi:hypothetical protein
MSRPQTEWPPRPQQPSDFEQDYPRTTLQWKLLNTWLGGMHNEPAQLTEPLRFHLWELMVTITVAAVLLALFRALGIVGAALAFIAAVMFTNLAFPRLSPNSPARQAAMFDFIWGAIMPLVCLTFDPFVFKYGDIPLLHEDFAGPDPMLLRTAEVYPWSWPIYAIIGWQVVCLGVWLVAGRLPACVAGCPAGMLWVGFAVACVVGVILAAPAAIASLMGIGLLGFTPLFTARAFYRRALMAGAVATRKLPASQAGFLALGGFWAALIVPGAAGWLWSLALNLAVPL